jgi:hypothetical protein
VAVLTVKGFNERRAPVTSVFLIASVLEVGLVIAAAVIFLTMIVAAVAAIVWLVAGLSSAAHQDPTPHH